MYLTIVEVAQVNADFFLINGALFKRSIGMAFASAVQGVSND